jgi:PhzF family phenazine biosynthesis protein
MATNVPSSLKYTIINAFTREIFKGNPACVFVLDAALPDTLMQSIATETNTPATAFCVRTEDPYRFHLRWFTAHGEISPCGHATLATSALLFDDDILPNAGTRINGNEDEDSRVITYDTKAGELNARKLQDGRVELNFPAGEVQAIEGSLSTEIGKVALHALTDTGSQPEIHFIGCSDDPQYKKFVLIELDASVNLSSPSVNISHLKEIGSHHPVILTAQSIIPGVSFVSRVFAPRYGMDEDPVTGSAHCILTPYWTKRLNAPPNQELAARQVSSRGGDLGVIWDRENGRCIIRGHTRVVARAEMILSQ